MFYHYKFFPVFFFIVMFFVVLFNAFEVFNTRTFRIVSRRSDARSIDGAGAVAVGVAMLVLSLGCLGAAYLTLDPPIW